MLTFLPAGWLDKVEPILIAPDVVDKQKWKEGHLWYEDDGHYILRVFQYVTPELAVNTKLVKKGEIPTWKSLLDPQWQGKLIVKDLGISGAGASLISYFYIMFGADFDKKLYRDQKPVISRDPRQSAQWLAQGSYPVLVGPDPAMVDQFQRLGYPVSAAFPNDGPSVLSGGWGTDQSGQQSPSSQRREVVHQLARRAQRANDVRRCYAGGELAQRRDLPRRAGVRIPTKRHEVHGHLRLRVRDRAARCSIRESARFTR
jgi:hypothetical protein